MFVIVANGGQPEESGVAQMPPADALAFGEQMASAVEAAHQRGVVYRDMKPTNLRSRTREL